MLVSRALQQNALCVTATASKTSLVIHLLTALLPALIQTSFNFNDLFRNPNSVSGVEVFTNILTVTRSKFF